MVSLTRTVRFTATHRLYRPDWTAERNRKEFGPVADYHTHDYGCRVTITGPMDPVSGMVMDLAQLDRILQDEVVTRLNRVRINEDTPPFNTGRPLPTCEALAVELSGHVRRRLPEGVRLVALRVAEDDTLHADWTEEA
ncbi:MAG: 6-pyruvoyl tetrahydropterin synthase family protein [Gemmatimonadales bacterium]